MIPAVSRRRARAAPLSRPPRTSLLHHPATAWVVLLLSFVLTALAWSISERAIRDSAAQRFRFETADIAEAISRRLLTYATALRGGAGLFNASEQVSRDEWRQYVEALRLQQNFPGIQGLGFTRMIAPGERDRHVAAIRAEGFPEYDITPAGARDIYSSIVYLEPFDWRNRRAFGYDMFSEPVRRAAMERARDSGEPAVSGRVILKQETDHGVQYGFLMYMPLYRQGVPAATPEERRAALLGFVYSPFRAADFMRGILGAGQAGIDLELYDGETPSADTLLHDSRPDGTLASGHEGAHGGFDALLTIPAGPQRLWTLHVHTGAGYLSSSEEAQPLIVAIGGICIDLLLFLTIASISRQKHRVEARLAESERRYSALFEGARSVMLLLDPGNGAIREANPEAQRFYGYTRDRMLRMTLGDLDTLPAGEAMRHLKQMVSGQRRSLLSCHRLVSGEIRQVEIHAGAFDHDASPVLYAIIHDVTERLRMEEALMESERRYREVMTATGDGLWDWDIRANRVSHNPRWGEILGLDGVLAAHPVEEFVALLHEDDRAAVMAAVRDALEGRAPYHHEHRMIRPDGGVVWVLDRGQVVERDAAGAPLRMVGSLSDVTRRVEQELALRIERERLAQVTERLQLATEAGNIGVWEWDIQSDTILWDERMYGLYGLPPRDDPRRIEHWTRRVHPEDLDRVQASLARAMRSETVFHEEFRILLPEEGMRHLAASGKIVRDARGKPGRMIGVNWDITEQRQARELAERAARVKSEFLANMSHEIRTPMNAIIGLSELALHRALAPEIRDYLDKIHRSARSLLGILNDILDYSKIEAGRLTLAPAPFDLGGLIKTLRQLFAHSAADKGLDFAIEVAHGIPATLIGDVLRLQQVLANLLGNAIKFTERGAVRLRIASVARQDDWVRLRWSVEDTGIGMDAATQTLLFQPFTQADGSIARRFGGTGLGLAISQELLTLMGTECEVTSTPGAGSVFAFELALEVASGTPARPAVARDLDDAEEAGGARPLAGARLLVAEDDPVNQQVIREFLELWGIQVTLAANGQEALDALDRAGFDAVLMDIQMPVVDGLTATRRIRARPDGMNLPILALSAGVTADERARVFAAGIDDFIGKPIDRVELLSCLRTWLNSAEPGGQTAASGARDARAIPPDALPGFDLTRLTPILRDRDHLIDLLEQFATAVGALPEEIAEALAAGDRVRAHALAHRLKGTAGNIGATELHAAAVALDAAFQRDGLSEQDALEERERLTLLRRAHAEALSRIADLRRDTPDTTGDPAAARACAARLVPLLDDMDLIPDALLADLAAAIPAEHAALYRTFRRHVDEIDYRQARLVLDRLLAALEPSIADIAETSS